MTEFTPSHINSNNTKSYEAKVCIRAETHNKTMLNFEQVIYKKVYTKYTFDMEKPYQKLAHKKWLDLFNF